MDIVILIINIVSLGVAIGGLISAWYFWKHSYNEIRAIRKLREIDFGKDHSFALLTRIFRESRERGLNISNPFQEGTPEWAIFNMLEHLSEDA